MRVMISQPTMGINNDEMAKTRAEVVAMLEEQGHEVWGEETITERIPACVREELWQLGRRFQAMAGADAVYFMDGWENSKVCGIASEAAKHFGLMEITGDMPQGLFSDMQLKKLTHGYREFNILIMDGNKVHIQGKFVYNYGNYELIAKDIEVLDYSVIGLSQKWIYQMDSRNKEIFPQNECLENADKRIFVNQASKLFINLRDAMLEGKIRTQFANQLRRIKYLLDDKGRYNIVNYQSYPIASLYAIACDAIF